MEQKFESFKSPPIVEAVIGITARGSLNDTLIDRVKLLTAEYQDVKVQRQFQHKFKIEPTTGVSEQQMQDLGFKGYRFQSKDKTQTIQFNTDGIIFSQKGAYPGWNIFKERFDELWGMYFELAKPMDIQRIGLRYINQILDPNMDERVEYFHANPQKPVNMELELKEFFYQEAYQEPNSEFSIAIMKGVQNQPNAGKAHILDIDVSTINPFLTNQELIDKKLNKMRELKNQSFHGSLTKTAREKFNQ